MMSRLPADLQSPLKMLQSLSQSLDASSLVAGRNFGQVPDGVASAMDEIMERFEFVMEEVPYSHNPTPTIPNPKLQTANQMATKRGRYRCTLRPSTT